MRARIFVSLLALIGIAVPQSHCGGAQEPHTPIGVPETRALADGGAANAARANAAQGTAAGALGPLALKVAPGRSYAFRVKSKSEQPGRKTEQDSTLYVDAWSDGTLLGSAQTGEHESTAMTEYLNDTMPLPAGAQSTYTKKRDVKERGDAEVTERFDRHPLGGGREQITFHIEKHRKFQDETADGNGIFDVTAGRYEKLHITRVRRMTPKGLPGATKGPVTRETRQEVDVDFDAEASIARTKEWGVRRETILKAAEQPAGSANVVAELAAALSGSTTNDALLEFHSRGRPVLVWKAVLAHGGAKDRLRGMMLRRREVPPEVAREVHAALKKSPSHAVSWLVLDGQDPKFLPELEVIAKRHEDEEAREYAQRLVKEMKKGVQPLAVRLKQIGSNAAALRETFWGAEVDPERDRVALFEFILPKLAGAGEEERAMYMHMLSQVSKASIGEDADAWAKFWETHKARPYEEWLIETLATDPATHARSQAAEALRERPPTEASKKALRAALEDSAPEVRIEAATALAAFHDDVAIRTLVRGLADEHLRWNAWTGLAHFSESDFGLGPSTKDEEVYAALGRWVGWAKRRGVDPGFP